jgi:hypothetical protein
MHAQKRNPGACRAPRVSNDQLFRINRATREGARRICSSRNRVFRKRQLCRCGNRCGVIPVAHSRVAP